MIPLYGTISCRSKKLIAPNFWCVCHSNNGLSTLVLILLCIHQFVYNDVFFGTITTDITNESHKFRIICNSNWLVWKLLHTIFWQTLKIDPEITAVRKTKSLAEHTHIHRDSHQYEYWMSYFISFVYLFWLKLIIGPCSAHWQHLSVPESNIRLEIRFLYAIIMFTFLKLWFFCFVNWNSKFSIHSSIESVIYAWCTQ